MSNSQISSIKELVNQLEVADKSAQKDSILDLIKIELNQFQRSFKPYFRINGRDHKDSSFQYGIGSKEDVIECFKEFYTFYKDHMSSTWEWDLQYNLNPFLNGTNSLEHYTASAFESGKVYISVSLSYLTPEEEDALSLAALEDEGEFYADQAISASENF